MKNSPTSFKCVLSGSKLIPFSTSWADEMKKFPNFCELKVTLQDWESKRSDRQNNFYHVHREWFRRIDFDRNGNSWTPAQSESMFKLWFGWYDVVERKDENGKVENHLCFRSTRDLSIEEFNQLFCLISEAKNEKWPDEYLPTCEV